MSGGETPEALVRAGRLDEALKALSEQVRAKPAEGRLRVFLFQILSVMGEWKRALTQLNVAADLDAANLLMANAYRPILQCEALRAQVFAGARSPIIFGDPQPWIASLVQALSLDAQGHAAQAAASRANAFEQAAPASGTVDGKPFEWIADADSRLGPCLEMIVDGRYGWAPWTHLKAISFEAPADLRDLVWAPAHVTWAAGGQTVAFVPVRYAGTETQKDAALRLGRRTDWRELTSETSAGLGQRLLATDEGDYPLLEVREIRLAAAGSST